MALSIVCVSNSLQCVSEKSVMCALPNAAIAHGATTPIACAIATWVCALLHWHPWGSAWGWCVEVGMSGVLLVGGGHL